MRKKWEYLTVEEKHLVLFPMELKKYGEVGWELVSVVQPDPGRWLIVYKRPLED